MGRAGTEGTDGTALLDGRRSSVAGAVLLGVGRREAQLVEKLRSVLTPDLLKPMWRDRQHPMAGHCYVASEAIYHLLGGREAGYTPQVIQHEGGAHWFLRGAEGEIIDPTADQFSTPVPYEQGRGVGFLTRQPSKRACVVIERLRR
jgi:hypothetical protein